MGGVNKQKTHILAEWDGRNGKVNNCSHCGKASQGKGPLAASFFFKKGEVSHWKSLSYQLIHMAELRRTMYTLNQEDTMRFRQVASMDGHAKGAS